MNGFSDPKFLALWLIGWLIGTCLWALLTRADKTDPRVSGGPAEFLRGHWLSLVTNLFGAHALGSVILWEGLDLSNLHLTVAGFDLSTLSLPPLHNLALFILWGAFGHMVVVKIYGATLARIGPIEPPPEDQPPSGGDK